MKNTTITALDVGSSFIRTIIARPGKDSRLEILGISEVPSEGIEKGVVKDIQAVANTIRKALEEAEKTAGIKADNIYVNITGEHIKTHIGDGRISIPTLSPNEPGEISIEHVEQVINDAKNSVKIQKGFERSKILHGIPQCFIIDGQDDIHNPINMNGFHLIARVYTIFADVTPMRNLSKCIELAGYDVDPDNFVLNHIAIGQSVLSDDERRLGTILIDIGGGTCDISLFNRGTLERVVVVPMAGKAITEDLAIGLKTTIANAEYIKTQFGIALAAGVDPKSEIEVEGISGRSNQRKSQQLVSHVIQHRVEEMLALCYNKLKNLYTPELITAGIVITGGSAKLQEIAQVVENAFNLHVKISMPDISRTNGMISRLDDPSFATALGILYYADGLGKEGKGGSSMLNSFTNFKIFDKIKKALKDFTQQ
ncbi:MAG: cell division protein FtsA [Candidatus Cloacimonadaceae bacterium]|nr:cell division protein FtsA [Candidatus Cloacimonadaceae bacterium]